MGVSIFTFKLLLIADPRYLKQAWIREDFWEIIDIYAVAETHLLKVENIPSNAESRQIYRYFTNETNVMIRLKDIKVEEKYFRPQDGICVVALKSAEGTFYLFFYF